MSKVYVEGGDNLITKMFLGRGWKVVSDIKKADLVCFSGGEDVCPLMYTHVPHQTTAFSVKRDSSSLKDYYRAPLHVPLVGICRGAQFLNVMAGGTLYQDVDRHAIGGTHTAYRISNDNEEPRPYQVTSTHHQMMIPTEEAEILLFADVATTRKAFLEVGGNGKDSTFGDPHPDLPDYEALFYEGNGRIAQPDILCFQPHPEYVEHDHECQQLFFDLLNEYLM